MKDYKSMYYYLSGQMATTIEVLEATTIMLDAHSKALAELKDKLKFAHKAAECAVKIDLDDSEE